MESIYIYSNILPSTKSSATWLTAHDYPIVHQAWEKLKSPRSSFIPDTFLVRLGGMSVEANSSINFVLIITMKQFYGMKYSILTLNDKKNKAKRTRR